jgi:hypothetical protein
MTRAVDNQNGEIDYDLAISLDAEDLAELGIQDAYRELAPHMAALGVEPRPITETIDMALGAYAVECDGHRYAISGPDLPDEHSWGLASHALFDIVNRQMAATDVRLFAISGGNDQFGIFMSPAQAERARRALSHKRDWPHLPTSEPPWSGLPLD